LKNAGYREPPVRCLKCGREADADLNYVCNRRGHVSAMCAELPAGSQVNDAVLRNDRLIKSQIPANGACDLKCSAVVKDK